MALSLAATGAYMVLFEVSHPPAGPATVIISLGIIWRPRELVIVELAVLLLSAQRDPLCSPSVGTFHKG